MYTYEINFITFLHFKLVFNTAPDFHIISKIMFGLVD